MKMRYHYTKFEKKLYDHFSSILCRIRYKLGIAEEGKDFFTCHSYSFCDRCEEWYQPCKKYGDCSDEFRL